jgi:long-chain acyl-CoA synthetase
MISECVRLPSVAEPSPVPGNVADLVRAAAERAPDPGRPALISGDQRLTWPDLDGRVDRAAAALRGLGLDRGDRVALQVGNTIDFAVAYFGALRAGLVAVPLNVSYTLPELHQLLTDSGAKVLVTSTVATIDGRAGLPDLALVVPGRIAPEGAVALEDLLAAAAGAGSYGSGGGGEDLAVLLYTSGTSGRPKGAMLTHRALLANLEQSAAVDPPPILATDTVLLALPLFHVYGLSPGLGMLAWAGATGVLVDRFDARRTLAAMAAERVSVVIGVPPMYLAWVAADPDELAAGFASVRTAISGAAPLTTSAYERIAAAGVSVHEGYGLTEAAPAVTSTLVGGQPRAGSVGWPLPGVEVALRDADGGPVEDDDPGEIVVRGPNLFSGYWPDGRDGPDGDGWWATGDVAYADDTGALYLVDRTKELIIVNGFNVYPAEVEAVLDSHPDVAESAVIGVPDERTGEAVRAYLVTRPGAVPTVAEVLAYAERSLARFKLPTSVELVPELPHSATGKVRKGELREATASEQRGGG